MIILAAGDSPIRVGVLPETVVIPVPQGARVVHLSYYTYRHIIERRENEKPEHVAVVLSRLRTVIENPSHIGCISGERHKVDLYGWTPEDFSGVLVSLKCLRDETWVSTAFPMGRKSLRKHLKTSRLVPVERYQHSFLNELGT